MGSNLARRAGVYHFRIRVPADVQACIHHAEVHRSLRTGDKRLAIRRARALSTSLQTLFHEARSGGLDDMTDAEITALINSYVRKLLDEDERQRVMHPGSAFEVSPEAYEYASKVYKLCLASPRTDNFPELLSKFRREYGIDLAEDSYEHRRLTHEFTKAMTQFIKVMEHRDQGDYDFEREVFGPPGQPQAANVPTTGPTQTQSPTPTQPQDMLSDVLTRWKNVDFPRLAPATQKEFDNATRLLVMILGDVPMRSIDHAACRNFVDTLQRLPSAWRKKKKYRDMGLKQVLASNIPVKERMTPRTTANIVTNVGTFLNWAVAQGYLDTNCLKGKAPKSSKATRSTRIPYTPAELTAVFCSDEYRNDGFNRPYKFWIPVLGLFTGARLEELCQLYVEDVKKVDGVWCLDINDDDDKRLKNESSRRLVPLHPFLTRGLKFHKWVESLRNKGRKRIFAELKRGANGKLGHAVSRWFGIYRKRCGASQPFHALRNTFADVCKQRNLELEKVAEVMGHETQSMTFGHYAQRYNPKILREDVVKKVTYPIDLDHLRESKFIKGLK